MRKLIDQKTGEIYEIENPVEDCLTIVEIEDGDKVIRKNQLLAIDEVKKRSEQPNFIFSIYSLADPYLEKGEMNSSDVCRLIVLATYCNYDNVLMSTQRKVMTKKCIEKILRFSNKTRFNKFYRKIVDLGFIREDENCVLLNESLFKKGKTEKKVGSLLTRLYIDEIRHIFESVSTRSMKKLGYVYMLLPYIHYDKNIVCKNTDNIYDDNPSTMTTGEFADMIGVNKRGIRRLVTDLLSIETIEGESLIGLFFTKNLSNGTIYINPNVIYSGRLNSDNRKNTNNMFKEDRRKRLLSKPIE